MNQKWVADGGFCVQTVQGTVRVSGAEGEQSPTTRNSGSFPGTAAPGVDRGPPGRLRVAAFMGGKPVKER